MAYRRAALFAFLQLLLVKNVAAIECTHPKIMTAPTQVDVQLGPGDEAGDMLVWDGAALCDGTSAPDGCASIGNAYGTCIALSAKKIENPNASFPNWDCADTLVFPDDGSTLVTRGIYFTRDADIVVVGGTGCYYGAQGYAKAIYNEEEKSYTYDLTMVDFNLDWDERDEDDTLSEKSSLRGRRRE
jgi:hypothetical protein